MQELPKLPQPLKATNDETRAINDLILVVASQRKTIEKLTERLQAPETSEPTYGEQGYGEGDYGNDEEPQATRERSMPVNEMKPYKSTNQWDATPIKKVMLFNGVIYFFKRPSETMAVWAEEPASWNTQSLAVSEKRIAELVERGAQMLMDEPW